jgi:hypothetical protein
MGTCDGHVMVVDTALEAQDEQATVEEAKEEDPLA